MMLDILLPKGGEGCDPNFKQTLPWRRMAADAKKARQAARVLALREMEAQGVRRGEFAPRFAVLVTYWHGHNVDVDNAAAGAKASIDGVFDALGANDRGLLAVLSVKEWTEKKSMHRKKRLILFDGAEGFKKSAALSLVLVEMREHERTRKNVPFYTLEGLSYTPEEKGGEE